MDLLMVLDTSLHLHVISIMTIMLKKTKKKKKRKVLLGNSVLAISGAGIMQRLTDRIVALNLNGYAV